MRRSTLNRENIIQQPKKQPRSRGKRDSRSRSSERWRSASTHILVELRETLVKNGGKINVTIIMKTLDIFRKISEVFGGTGYDEVFKIMIKIFEESIFSKENRTFDDVQKSFVATPYFKLYKSLLEERDKLPRRNTTIGRRSDRGEDLEERKIREKRQRSSSIGRIGVDPPPSSISTGELLPNYGEYQTKKLNELRKNMATKESHLHDLQYDRYVLNEENKELKHTLGQEKHTHIKAYSDVLKVVKKKEEEISVLKEQIQGLMEYRKNIQGSKIGYLEDKQTNSQLDHKNMFSTANQIRTLRKLHTQLQLIENQKIDNYTNRTFALVNDKPNKNSFFITEGIRNKPNEDRSAKLDVEKRGLKESFVNQVNLLTHQMNLLKDRTEKLVSGNSDITIDGRKLEIQEESSKDSQERREALKQRVKNFSFDDSTYRFRPFEMINPLNFQNKLEVYIKKKKSPEMIEAERKLIDRKKFGKVFNTSSDISQFGRRWSRIGSTVEKKDERLLAVKRAKRTASNFTSDLIQKLERNPHSRFDGQDGSEEDDKAPKIDQYYFELFHRETLSVQKPEPTTLDLPEGVTELKLQHSRYHHTIPHSNVDNVLYSNKQMMANLAIFEKLKAPKPLPLGDPLWAFYIRRYGRKAVPPTPRKLSLKNLRETIFQVYLVEFVHPRKYGKFSKAPTMAELLDKYLNKEYGVSEIAQKVYYETLRSVQYFSRDRGFRDIIAFHNSIMGQQGTVVGRCMAIMWKFAEWIYQKESAQDVRVIVAEQKYLHVDDLREEFFPKVYKGTGIRDIDLMIEDLSTFFSFREERAKEAKSPKITTRALRRVGTKANIIRKTKFLMNELLEFLFSRIHNSREYWCRKFLEDQLKILNKVKIYKHEFSQVMAKICPRFSGEDVDYRFDEMCKYQQGHQMDTSKLAVIFSMFNLMESYTSDKEV